VGAAYARAPSPATWGLRSWEIRRGFEVAAPAQGTRSGFNVLDWSGNGCLKYPAVFGGVTVSTCLVNVEQRVEVLDPRKSSGKFSIANTELALAA
jgi:hypothetical protein